MTTDPFFTHRSLLFTVAYEMLGSAADAEDVVRESWLRWADVDRSQVRNPRAYLVQLTTRQALNRLRTLSRSREDYVGEWLPEPLLTTPDIADDIELAESVSIAMLAVLETLKPTERAVFVLREVFDVPYGEIAEAVGRSAAAVRQMARRARRARVGPTPRVQADRFERQAVVQEFLAALRTGQVQDLIDVLAPAVVLIADGGESRAPLRPPSTEPGWSPPCSRAQPGGLLRPAQRRSGRPGRDRRPTGRSQLRRGRWTGHPNPRGSQPRQAGSAERARRTHQIGTTRMTEWVFIGWP